MLNDGEALHPQIKKELAGLFDELLEAGWTVIGSDFSASSFGNWFVDLTRGGRAIRLVKDRSQYWIDDGSSPAERQAAEIDGVFNLMEEFAAVVYRVGVLRS